MQRPHPPILIGGSGERKTLRLVAQYADACNLFDIQGSQFRDNLTRKLGRAPRALRAGTAATSPKSRRRSPATSTSARIPRPAPPHSWPTCASWPRPASSHALVSPRRAWDEATFDAVAAILPEVHAIEPERG